MSKPGSLLLALALTLARFTACAAELTATSAAPTASDVREGPTVLPARDNCVGELIPDLAYTDLAGKPGKLSDLRSAKAIVICMTGATCPVAQKYGPTVAELAKAYSAKGVAFVLVNPSTAESPDKLKAAAAALSAAGFTGTYVPDPQGKLAKTLRAASTAEAFVLDAARTLVYRGAIDDQFGLGYGLDQPRRRYLANALDAVLAHQSPAIAATTAPGCVLSPGDAAPSGSAVTYHNRISRIVQARCVECHRKGENAPFELATYDDVKGNAAMIKRVINKRTMPPWFAEKSAAHPFRNDRSLTDREIADVTKWIDAGCPVGDSADAPLPPQFVEGWRIGKPDAIFAAPQPQDIPAKGTIRYRYVLVPTNLTEDKWVTAMEVRPSAPAVVHHLLVFLKLPPEDPRARAMGQQFQGGLNGYFAGMVPGQGDIAFPDGTAKLLPKGATLVFQIHYTANGTATQDTPRIGFKFASKPPEHEIHTRAAANRFFVIPPGADNAEVAAYHTFFQPTRLLSVNPHSHVRGKAFRYELTYPDGRTEVILDLPRYDFNWQIEHQFATPLDLPAGTKLKVTGWYDNSDKNPANPDPTKAVKFGEQTWQEMMIGYFTGYVIP